MRRMLEEKTGSSALTTFLGLVKALKKKYENDIKRKRKVLKHVEQINSNG